MRDSQSSRVTHCINTAAVALDFFATGAFNFFYPTAAAGAAADNERFGASFVADAGGACVAFPPAAFDRGANRLRTSPARGEAQWAHPYAHA
jgi:hypothetical protein